MVSYLQDGPKKQKKVSNCNSCMWRLYKAATEYWNEPTFRTPPVLIQMKELNSVVYVTLFCVIIYTSYKLLETVRFFGPPVRDVSVSSDALYNRSTRTAQTSAKAKLVQIWSPYQNYSRGKIFVKILSVCSEIWARLWKMPCLAMLKNASINPFRSNVTGFLRKGIPNHLKCILKVGKCFWLRLLLVIRLQHCPQT